ncbi:barstar family protein [Enterococcus sp. LJL51]|uniref:barstar family protein n=1 Tax=Enterococcus sp. LJL51 TaxID=3416656 RepID=UPI003CFA324E
MENKIYKVNNKEFSVLKNARIKNKNIKIAILNGEELCSKSMFIQEMIRQFNLPMKNTNNFDGFLDWMRDLEWIHEQEIVVVIYNFDNCIEDSGKKEIIKMFGQMILPFWEKEVEEVVMGGKRRNFNVYLVD